VSDPGSDPDADTIVFLVRCAREYRPGGCAFTGFHWPVLAGEAAARLYGDRVVQVLEAGAVVRGPARRLPTSTTDYHALDGSWEWTGSTSVVFPALVRRADLVVLDAANVDLAGRINSTAVGPYARPRVRLAGGGGAADAAYAARELVLLHGSRDPSRIVRRVEHVTAAPGPHARVRLVTRWGTLRLGDGPALLERATSPPDQFERLGVELAGAVEAAPPSTAERAAATAVLHEAAQRGYTVAREAIAR
jgi:glutaconate CoA-transferase, subunit B